ncbi:hypothetical protein Dimus_031837, partial [Dionaea muscipula]
VSLHHHLVNHQPFLEPIPTPSSIHHTYSFPPFSSISLLIFSFTQPRNHHHQARSSRPPISTSTPIDPSSPHHHHLTDCGITKNHRQRESPTPSQGLAHHRHRSPSLLSTSTCDHHSTGHTSPPTFVSKTTHCRWPSPDEEDTDQPLFSDHRRGVHVRSPTADTEHHQVVRIVPPSPRRRSPIITLSSPTRTR